ncbi:hypothetical protein PhCBS80983_g02141 [Powellomyces hirtus]|uniref:Uncharacterized protein n=1 Tax=Powellomyces hirtus TaxID=109895 RepID=A0A507EA01_9FUNG|nr:hypothetical protein PhCBS80983_g02141 [Powellomyces hirtus]
MAENFKHNYLLKCAELCIEPHRALTEVLNKHAAGSWSSFDTLDLRGQTATVKDCAALAAALSNDVLFTKINLADSFLDDDVLEWNCIGIWQAGVRSLADGLSVNQALEDLDLRNNKIGPEGTQTLAICLKSNMALRRLDLRWNNIGLLGSKAIVDLLKWNNTLAVVQLAGNEVPDDLGRAINIALERNADRRKHVLRNRAVAEDHANQMEQLGSTHRGFMNDLRKDLVWKDLQLDAATKDVAKSREAYKILEHQLARAKDEAKYAAETFERERNNMKNMLDAALKQVAEERDAQDQMSSLRDKANSLLKQRELEFEAGRCEADVKRETSKRENAALREELEKLREKLRSSNIVFDEQLKQQQSDHGQKMTALEISKDSFWGDKVRKLEERLRKTETEYARLEDNNNTQRSSFVTEKRQWADRLAEAEARVRRENDDRWKEMESNLAAMTCCRDSLQSKLSHQSQLTAKAVRELDAERERWQQARAELVEEIANLEARHAKSSFARTQLEDVQNLLREAESRTAIMSRQLSKLHEERVREGEQRQAEVLKLHEDIDSRERLIARLKEQVKMREHELQEREEESVLQMKELQLSIATLVNQRTRNSIRSRSLDKPL